MKYLLKTRNSWIATENEASESELVRKIKGSGLIISDLDGTDASPGIKLILEMMLTQKYTISRHMWRWALKTIKNYATNDEAESSSWKSFVETFLRNESELERMLKKISLQDAERNLYKGVKEFYQLLPHTEKAYISRNIAQIVKAYQQALSFDHIFAESFDKSSTAKQLLQQIPHTKVIIKGNSAEEQKIANYLRELQKNRRVQTVVYINVARTTRQYNPQADINTSRNHTAMNKWLRQNIYQA